MFSKISDRIMSDRIMSDIERRNTIDQLHGNICRICVTDNPTELFSMLEFAYDRLLLLSNNRLNELNQNKK